jgi:hypothetical protein
MVRMLPLDVEKLRHHRRDWPGLDLDVGFWQIGFWWHQALTATVRAEPSIACCVNFHETGVSGIR